MGRPWDDKKGRRLTRTWRKPTDFLHVTLNQSGGAGDHGVVIEDTSLPTMGPTPMSKKNDGGTLPRPTFNFLKSLHPG